jgi:N4-gp56 family major capsid protein
MATNTSAQFQADIRRILDHDVLRLAQRYLVVYQHARKKSLEKNSGTVWTATRFNRLPLPVGPLSEGVPPTGENITISQVTGIALQWGDKVTITDVAELTIEHDLIQQAKRLLGYQIAELKESNAFNQLASGTQVNYVNSRGARASIVAGDVLDPFTVNRTVSNLKNLGAPLIAGQTETNIQRGIEHNAKAVSKQPMSHEHYVAVGSPIVLNDFANNPTVVQAWSYSDVTRLYINEAGYWRGMHFCESNMVPSWVGVAAVNGTAGTAGSLATGSYFVQVTGWDTQNQYESRIYQVSSSISVTGPTGSVSVTMPSTAGFTYAVYIGTSSSPANLGLSTSGPTSGPYAGQAIQIPASTAVTITGTGLFQVPPAAPATGVTVFPTFVFGEDYFACLTLENIKWTSLFEADKSDPLNQLRVVGYKFFEGFVIENQQFGARIESSASNTGTFG